MSYWSLVPRGDNIVMGHFDGKKKWRKEKKKCERERDRKRKAK